jgi:hypothetical protein
MKFHNIDDIRLFLLEVGSISLVESVNEDFTPTEDQINEFILARRPMESLIKNHRKSQIAKGSWRRNRTQMMKGIKAFHRSTEGKRFHRNLGNFLATRFTTRDTGRTATNESIEFLKALNSAKTHLYIELEYFHQLHEQVELDDMAFNYAYNLFRDIEDSVIKQIDFNEDQVQFLLDITEANALIQSLSTKSKKSISQVEKVWNDIKKGLEKSGMKDSEEKFYPILVSTLKKKLNLT